MPTIVRSFEVDAPLPAVWEFHQRADVLKAITPPQIRVFLPDPVPALGPDVRFTLEIAPTPLPFRVRWETVVDVFEPPTRFVDTQGKGPFRSWRHEHRFEPISDTRSRIVETIDYVPPFGILGKWADRWFLRALLENSFAHREVAIQRLLSEQTRRVPISAPPVHSVL